MPASLDQRHLCSAATITLYIFPSVIPPHKNRDFRIYADKNTLFLQFTNSTASPPTLPGAQGRKTTLAQKNVPGGLICSPQHRRWPAFIERGEGCLLLLSTSCRNLTRLTPGPRISSWASVTGGYSWGMSNLLTLY